MKIHRLLYKPESVIADLDGRKMQTRRIITRYNSLVDGRRFSATEWDALDHSKASLSLMGCRPRGNLPITPVIQPGHEIHFCETWAVRDTYDDRPPRYIPEDTKIWYRADGEGRFYQADFNPIYRGRWRPSIHMCDWMVRPALKHTVISTRPERIQDISEEDARAEGFGSRVDFVAGWDGINGYRPGCVWADNLLVWAYDWRER